MAETIVITEEYWANSFLSVARHTGRINYNGSTFLIVNKEGKTVFECSLEADKEGREKAKLGQRLSGKIYRLNNHRSKKVMKLKDGKRKIYNSLSEAKRKENFKSHKITHVINGRNMTSNGAEWV